MAKPPPDDDPRVTDLRTYKKAREAAAKRTPKPNAKAQMRETFLGSNPRGPLILAIIVVLLVAFYVVPLFL